MMKKGFTIIELLVVLAIIGILLGIVTTAAASSIKQARARKADAAAWRRQEDGDFTGDVKRLEALLDALGVPEHPGRECLRRAVALAWADRRTLRALRASLYPRACAETGLTPVQAERAIRHAIDVAWREGAIEQQHRVFGETIDARRGKPTCGEMIAQLAEELRWEE